MIKRRIEFITIRNDESILTLTDFEWNSNNYIFCYYFTYLRRNNYYNNVIFRLFKIKTNQSRLTFRCSGVHKTWLFCRITPVGTKFILIFSPVDPYTFSLSKLFFTARAYLFAVYTTTIGVYMIAEYIVGTIMVFRFFRVLAPY